MPGDISLAERYHLETKYTEESVRRLPPMGQQPALYKDFQSDRSIDLQPHLPFPGFPFAEQAAPRLELTPPGSLLPRLARLLYFTNGVTGFVKHPDGLTLFRAAPSAGGLYPTEIYLVTEGVEGLEDGLHNFSVAHNRLTPVFDGELLDELSAACFGHPAAQRARAMLILTAVLQRSSFRYHDRAYRRILLDTGHVLGNLCAYASEEQLTPVPLSCFADDVVNQLLFLDPLQECAMAVVPLLEGDVADESFTRLALHRSKDEGTARRPGESLLQALHHGSTIERPKPITIPRLLESPSVTAEPCAGRRVELEQGVGAVIARRRSTRVLAGGPLPRRQVEEILHYGYAPQERGWLAVADLIETHVVALRVTGLEPGVYRYSPRTHRLALARAGKFASIVHRICLQQDLARDAAAVIVHVADLPNSVVLLGNRAYRELHLEAGLIGEWLNLAALSLGVGVSGIGGFFDDEVASLLGVPTDRAILYLTLLGEAEAAD
ncbi:MAG: SagB/ThcOx family dehydrogenase [Planctomycetota bacterium]